MFIPNRFFKILYKYEPGIGTKLLSRAIGPKLMILLKRRLQTSIYTRSRLSHVLYLHCVR